MPNVGQARQERDAIADAVALSCPIDRYPLEPDPRGGAAHHRRTCVRCGAVVLFPRVPLMRALRRARRLPK